MSSCKKLRIMKGSEARGLGCGVWATKPGQPIRAGEETNYRDTSLWRDRKSHSSGFRRRYIFGSQFPHWLVFFGVVTMDYRSRSRDCVVKLHKVELAAKICCGLRICMWYFPVRCFWWFSQTKTAYRHILVPIRLYKRNIYDMYQVLVFCCVLLILYI